MKRAFVADEGLADVVVEQVCPLPDDVEHRFRRVLRLVAGAAVELFDDNGRVVRGTLRDDAAIDVVSVTVVDDALPPLVVVQGLTKTDKLELVVQKATELGASKVLLYAARRSQVRLTDERGDKKVSRLQRIAQDAARQCGRGRPPEVEGPINQAALLKWCTAFVADGGVVVLGVVDGDGLLSMVLKEALVKGPRAIAVVVGPEGGLDPDEVDALCAAGARGVRFSAHVLRTETAALAALTVCQVALGHA